MKISLVVTESILVAILMMSMAFAENVAVQISDLTPMGTTALTAPGVASRTQPESHRHGPHHVDLPDVRPTDVLGSTPPRPVESNVIDHATARGFIGLTHLDQWSAGTGIYANSQFSTEPPDQGLAVGSRFVLEAVNAALAVYDQRGKVLAGPTAFNQFFHLAPEISQTGEFGDFVTDPECYFDQQTQRWFITIAQVDVDPITGNFGPRGHILIAVSKTNDPTREFNLFRIDATDDGNRATPFHTGCPCFSDQPHVGADRNGFYISTNEFNIASLNGSPSLLTGAQIYAISKQSLVEGDELPTVVHLVPELSSPDIPYSIIPAKSFRVQDKSGEQSNNGAGGVEYFLSTPDITNPLDNRLAVWAISNTDSLANAKPDLKLAKVIFTSEVYGPPPSAEQKFGPTSLRDFLATPQAPTECFFQAAEPLEKLHTNNDRIQQVVFVDGTLWAGLNTVVGQSNGKQRAGIAFFSVVPSMSGAILKAGIAKQGYLSVPREDVLNPAIAVDGSGRATMVFTLAGPDIFPSAAYVNIAGADPLKVHVIAAGVAPEDGFTGYDACTVGAMGIARWGDYSAATTDEHGNIWVATEFIRTESSGIPGTGTFFAHWGTFIATAGSDNQ
jgi:hypothetical protein